MEIIQYANSGASASIGIGSTVESGTSKSVLYINGSGQVSQDNAGFNYTEASDLLTVGKITLADGAVATPSLYWGTDMGFYRVSNTLRYGRGGQEYIRIGSDGRISIAANASGTITSNGLIHAVYDADPEDQDGILVVDTASNEGWTTSIGGRRSRGTSAVRTATQSGDKLVEFMAKGHTGSAFSASNRGYLGFYAAEDFSAGNQGVYSEIGTTTTGTSSNHVSIYISHKGDVAITKASGGMTGTYSTGFTTGNNAKVLEVRADSTTDDAGLFIHNSNATKGLGAWIDTSASTVYIDSMYDNAAGLLSFRMKSLNGTPITALSIDSTGKAVTYNGITLVNNGLASVVAKVNLTGQTAAIGATTIYTADADGFYVVGWAATITTAATSSSTLGNFQVRYTNVADSTTKSTATQNNVTASASNATGACVNGSFTIYAKSGTAIQYIIGYASSGATAMVYSLDVIVTKL